VIERRGVIAPHRLGTRGRPDGDHLAADHERDRAELRAGVRPVERDVGVVRLAAEDRAHARGRRQPRTDAGRGVELPLEAGAAAARAPFPVLARDGHPAGQVARVDLGRVRAQVIAHQRRAHAQVLDRGQPEPVRAGLEVGSRRKAGRTPERLDPRRGQGAQPAQVNGSAPDARSRASSMIAGSSSARSGDARARPATPTSAIAASEARLARDERDRGTQPEVERGAKKRGARACSQTPARVSSSGWNRTG
jgi:hypothetical protein